MRMCGRRKVKVRVRRRVGEGGGKGKEEGGQLSKTQAAHGNDQPPPGCNQPFTK